MLPQAKQTINNTSTVLHNKPYTTTISPFIKCPGGHRGHKGSVNRSRLPHEVEENGPAIVAQEGVRRRLRETVGRLSVNLSVVDILWFFVGSQCRVPCGTHVLTNFVLFSLLDLAWLKDYQCKCGVLKRFTMALSLFLNAVYSIVLC